MDDFGVVLLFAKLDEDTVMRPLSRMAMRVMAVAVITRRSGWRRRRERRRLRSA